MPTRTARASPKRSTSSQTCQSGRVPVVRARVSQQDVEGLAAEVLDRHDIDEPVSPWEVTAALGVRVIGGGRGTKPRLEWRADEDEYVAIVDEHERMGRLGAAVLHELAHLLLRLHRLPNDEDHAWRLAAAMLLPRDHFLRQYRRARGRLEELAGVFPHASNEMIARRLVGLSDSLHLWVWDVAPERRRYRVLSPGWQWHSRRPTPLELEAMELALEERRAVEPVGGVRAWPVLDDPYERVLCLADGEVLLGTVR